MDIKYSLGIFPCKLLQLLHEKVADDGQQYKALWKSSQPGMLCLSIWNTGLVHRYPYYSHYYCMNVAHLK